VELPINAAAQDAQLIKTLLNGAMQHAPEERSAFLNQACPSDAEVRKEVERLLAEHEQTRRFSESPVHDHLHDDPVSSTNDLYSEGELPQISCLSM
jgi:hypothetical protein